MADTASKQRGFAGLGGGWDHASFGTLGQDGQGIWKNTTDNLHLPWWSVSWNSQEWGPADSKAGTPVISGLCAAVLNNGCVHCKMLWKIARIRQKCYFLTLLDSYFVFQARNRWRQLELGVALQYFLCLCYDSIFQLFNKWNHALVLKAKNKSLLWMF